MFATFSAISAWSVDFPHDLPVCTALAQEPTAVGDFYSFLGDCMTMIHAE